MKVADIVAALQVDFPEEIASKGDPVGMQIGSLTASVTKIMTTLDVRPQVVAEAIEQGVDLIISHHPLMFHPVSNLYFDTPQKRMYGALIKHGIAVYSIHTNSDKANNGSSDWQAEELGLKDIRPFCPDEDGIAIGRKGKLPQIMTAKEFAYYVKAKMHLQTVRLITADNEQAIEQIGFICGDGTKYWPEAVHDKLDAFISSDVYYHTGHDIISAGLTVVDPGHYTESIFKDKLYAWLKNQQQLNNWPVKLVVSQVSTNPFQDLY